MSFQPITLKMMLEPRPKARPRFTTKGYAYNPPENIKFEIAVANEWRKSKLQMIPKVPTVVSCWFFLRRPKSNKSAIPIVKPDVDNLKKAILDALNGLAWQDDNQICDSHAHKRWSDGDPYIHINILPIGAL